MISDSETLLLNATSNLYDFEAYLVWEGFVFVIPGDETPKVLYTSGNRIRFAFSCPFSFVPILLVQDTKDKLPEAILSNCTPKAKRLVAPAATGVTSKDNVANLLLFPFE